MPVVVQVEVYFPVAAKRTARIQPRPCKKPGRPARPVNPQPVLAQIHFHTPAEHQVDGITYPMEMHMVHTSDDNAGRYPVIGVLFREGGESPALEDILAAVPERVGETNDVPASQSRPANWGLFPAIIFITKVH